MARITREISRKKKSLFSISSVKSSVGFVVRTRSAKHASDDVKNALRILCMPKKYDGVFVNLDVDTIGRC